MKTISRFCWHIGCGPGIGNLAESSGYLNRNGSSQQGVPDWLDFQSAEESVDEKISSSVSDGEVSFLARTEEPKKKAKSSLSLL